MIEFFEPLIDSVSAFFHGLMVTVVNAVASIPAIDLSEHLGGFTSEELLISSAVVIIVFLTSIYLFSVFISILRGFLPEKMPEANRHFIFPECEWDTSSKRSKRRYVFLK